MVEKKRESGEFVIPGDRLGVAEEFAPGPGTYEVEGTIYSGLTGYSLKDALNKTVSVKPTTRRPVLPSEGASVIGVVASAQGRMATLNIVKIRNKYLRTPFTGLLHISTSSPRYERAMGEVCKATDVVRARIMSVKNRVAQLTTIGEGLGVVRACCSRCGHPLILDNKKKLKCKNCGNVEMRKTANDYGTELL